MSSLASCVYCREPDMLYCLCSQLICNYYDRKCLDCETCYYCHDGCTKCRSKTCLTCNPSCNQPKTLCNNCCECYLPLVKPFTAQDNLVRVYKPTRFDEILSKILGLYLNQDNYFLYRYEPDSEPRSQRDAKLLLPPCAIKTYHQQFSVNMARLVVIEDNINDLELQTDYKQILFSLLRNQI